MPTEDPENRLEQLKYELEDGCNSDMCQNYKHLLKDSAGVIDSILITFDDTYGTVQDRRPHLLYRKYKEKIHDGRPELDEHSYGKALAALQDMGLVQRNTDKANILWQFEETEPDQLKSVRDAAEDVDIENSF